MQKLVYYFGIIPPPLAGEWKPARSSSRWTARCEPRNIKLFRRKTLG